MHDLISLLHLDVPILLHSPLLRQQRVYIRRPVDLGLGLLRLRIQRQGRKFDYNLSVGDARI